MGPFQVIAGVPSSDSETVQVRVMVDSPAIPLGFVGVIETEIIESKNKYIAIKKIYWYNLVEREFILQSVHNSPIGSYSPEERTFGTLITSTKVFSLIISKTIRPCPPNDPLSSDSRLCT